jgi:SMI1 / KNR4 family (SUKH-1)
MTPEPELKLDPRPVDPSTIIHGRRFSVENYTRTALVDRFRFDGSKPTCPVRGATDAMLDDTESRLGFKLPRALRTLYKQRNGASVDVFWVANKANPQPIYDDWEDAFANDYNDLRPLEELHTLHALYMEDFNPEYDEDQRQYWFPASEKIVILAKRIAVGTALDYRFGEAPGVILFDLGQEGDARVRLRFDSFDAFLSALRREVEDVRPPLEIVDEAPDASRPNRFWCYDTFAATDGVTEASWAENATRLGCLLPDALKPFYEAVNGGNTRFLMDSQHPSRTDDRDSLGPFSDTWSYYAASMLPIERWISLRELSDRIEFDPRGTTPWATRWREPERLVVISASFDQALMLDYRDGDSPAVIFTGDLNEGRETQRYASVAEFVSRLRPVQRMRRELFPAIVDARLSARVPTVESFWCARGEQPPASEALLKQTSERIGAPIPDALATLYATQNGGAVTFCFHPPEIENVARYRNEDTAASTWIDFFPGGLLPMQDWLTIDQWAKRESVKIDCTQLSARSMRYSSDATFGFVVLSEAKAIDAFNLTLLDVSSDYFNREKSLLRARYSLANKSFEVLIEQKMLEHVSLGVLQRMRAPMSSLKR